jgi:hypothetical protein
MDNIFTLGSYQISKRTVLFMPTFLVWLCCLCLLSASYSCSSPANTSCDTLRGCLVLCVCVCGGCCGLDPFGLPCRRRVQLNIQLHVYSNTRDLVEDLAACTNVFQLQVFWFGNVVVLDNRIFNVVFVVFSCRHRIPCRASTLLSQIRFPTHVCPFVSLPDLSSHSIPTLDLVFGIAFMLTKITVLPKKPFQCGHALCPVLPSSHPHNFIGSRFLILPYFKSEREGID